MCTKSKTSFGCGHCVKVTDSCGVSGCTNLVRYKMPDKEHDCAQCKSESAGTTRGREGRGRYAREIRTRDSRHSSNDSLPPDSPHLTISPWLAAGPSDSKAKKWDGPTRRLADDAWVVEHERRISDLDEKSSKMSLSSHLDSLRGSRRTSPTSSYERVIEADEVEEPQEIEPVPIKSRAIKLLPYEISDDSDKSRSPRRSPRMSYHSHSQVLVTPRRQLQVASAITEHDSYEAHRPVHVPHGHGPNPGAYRPRSQSCYLDSPFSSSQSMGAHWQGGYGGIQSPLQHDVYYPRQYTVY